MSSATLKTPYITVSYPEERREYYDRFRGIHQLTKRPDGNWECSVDLTSGDHEYGCIVDGKWRSDPNNREIATNEFGEANSLVIVP